MVPSKVGINSAADEDGIVSFLTNPEEELDGTALTELEELAELTDELDGIAGATTGIRLGGILKNLRKKKYSLCLMSRN